MVDPAPLSPGRGGDLGDLRRDAARSLIGLFSPGEVVSGRVEGSLGDGAYAITVRGRTLVAESAVPLQADAVVRLRLLQEADGQLRVRLDTGVADQPADAGDALLRRLTALGLPGDAAAAQVLAAFEEAGAPLLPARLQAALAALRSAAANPAPAAATTPAAPDRPAPAELPPATVLASARTATWPAETALPFPADPLPAAGGAGPSRPAVPTPGAGAPVASQAAPSSTARPVPAVPAPMTVHAPEAPPLATTARVVPPSAQRPASVPGTPPPDAAAPAGASAPRAPASQEPRTVATAEPPAAAREPASAPLAASVPARPSPATGPSASAPPPPAPPSSAPRPGPTPSAPVPAPAAVTAQPSPTPVPALAGQSAPLPQPRSDRPTASPATPPSPPDDRPAGRPAGRTAAPAAATAPWIATLAPSDPARPGPAAPVTPTTSPDVPADAGTGLARAHARLALAGLPATPALVALAQTAGRPGLPDLGQALQDLGQALRRALPAQEAMPPALRAALASLAPATAVPDPAQEGAPGVLRALIQAGLRLGDGLAAGQPADEERPRTTASAAAEAIPLRRQLASLAAELPPPPANDPRPPGDPQRVLAEAVTRSAREATAQEALPPRSLADYDHVVPLALRCADLPTPARLAVASRPSAGGGRAAWLRVDAELSELGPVSVRLGAADGGPVAITVVASARTGRILAEDLPDLIADLQAVGLVAAVRIATPSLEADDG